MNKYCKHLFEAPFHLNYIYIAFSHFSQKNVKKGTQNVQNNVFLGLNLNPGQGIFHAKKH